MVDFYRFDCFDKQAGLLHAVTKKSNDMPYGFSMALHTGEELERIVENRNKLSILLNINHKIHYVVANQTHSDHIEIIDKEQTKGWQDAEDAVKDCDALITNKDNVILTMLTADCVPVLMYDKEKKVVAAVHAGWKGTEKKIVAKTVKKMIERYGCKAENIEVGIAPSIGKCCYEVGEDVASHFLKYGLSLEKKGEKHMLDLPDINERQLLEVGIKEENIEMSGICTSCQNNEYFSYRKEKGCSGRFMSLIGMKVEVGSFKLEVSS